MGIFYDLKMHSNPNRSEWKKMLFTVLFLGFIIGFNDRSSDVIGVSYFKNMIIGIIVVFVSLFIANLAGRIHATSMGYKSSYDWSINGLLIGVMLAFVSNGFLWFFSPGQHVIEMNEKARLGHFRYGLRMKDWARSATTIVIAHVILAVIAFLSSRGNPVVDLFVSVNIFLALYNLLPFPENNGINIFFGERNLYFFCIGFVIAVFSSMKFVNNFIATILIGLIIGFLAIFYINNILDKK